MIKIHIQAHERWDERTETFYGSEEAYDFKLEHSLASISKWEAKYHKPFLSSDKSNGEMIDYFRMMVVGEEPESLEPFLFLTKAQIDEIGKYINDSQTATTFSKEEDEEAAKKAPSDKFTTSEELYYYMTAQNIPFECQFWHLNRLITLIKVCAIKNKPEDKKKKKLTSSDLAARRLRMEAARKKYGG